MPIVNFQIMGLSLPVFLKAIFTTSTKIRHLKMGSSLTITTALISKSHNEIVFRCSYRYVIEIKYGSQV